MHCPRPLLSLSLFLVESPHVRAYLSRAMFSLALPHSDIVKVRPIVQSEANVELSLLSLIEHFGLELLSSYESPKLSIRVQTILWSKVQC